MTPLGCSPPSGGGVGGTVIGVALLSNIHRYPVLRFSGSEMSTSSSTLSKSSWSCQCSSTGHTSA